jgi:hypothetical protein
MTAYSPDAWNTFFAAQAAASAALAGLLFVGISINVGKITASTRLVRRALEGFVLLVEVLLLSALTLVPGISRGVLGWGLLAISTLAWVMVLRLQIQTVAVRNSAEAAAAPRGSLPAQVVLGQAATVPFVVGAVALIANSGGGLYWFPAGVIFAFLASLADAWVLVIEIQR